MFSRISRYRGLPDEATLDARGRVLAWKSLRLLPDAPGTFLHTVESADRLDHLGYKYYGQTRDWWRIADANPSFLSPLALLGAEPRETVRIPAEWRGPAAPWPVLLRTLRETPGVERAAAGTPEQPYAVTSVLEGPPLFDLDLAAFPALPGALEASGRAQSLDPAVQTALLGGGVALPQAVRIEMPDTATWIVSHPPTSRVYTLRRYPDEEIIRVFGSGWTHAWVVEAEYDTTALAQAELLALVEGEGFLAGPPAPVGRVGKPIVVPPRRL